MIGVVNYITFLYSLANLLNIITSCSLTEARIKVGSDGVKTVALQSDSKEKFMVKEGKECKFSIKLAGECDILQSNIIFKSLNNARKHDNYGYLGLKCEDNICRATLRPGEINLHNEDYLAQVLVASKKKGDEKINIERVNFSHFDFSQALIPPMKTQLTADQMEDVFEKIQSENRPNFDENFPIESTISIVGGLIGATIVLIPLLIFLVKWNGNQTVISNISKLSAVQSGFLLCYIAWMILAVSDWAGLGTFPTIKVATLLSIPTFILGLKGFRQSITSK